MKILIPSILIFSTISCKQMCLSKEMGAVLDKATMAFKETMTVEYIPCEPITINIILKSDVADTAEIGKLHAMLYDSTKNLGWVEIDVFAQGHKYRFTHNYDGYVFNKRGN